MFTPFKDNYGYGWVIDKKYGRTRYAHGGGIMGFVTIIERYPDEKLLVVALSNLENSPIGAIGNDLAAIAMGEQVRHPPRAEGGQGRPGPLRRLRRPVRGRRARQGQGGHHGLAGRDRLLCQPKGKSRVVLMPESETSFYIRAGDSEARFVKDSAGKVTHLILIQDGEEITARQAAGRGQGRGRGEAAARR